MLNHKRLVIFKSDIEKKVTIWVRILPVPVSLLKETSHHLQWEIYTRNISASKILGHGLIGTKCRADERYHDGEMVSIRYYSLVEHRNGTGNQNIRKEELLAIPLGV